MLFAVTGRFKPDVEARREAVHEDYNVHLTQPNVRVRLGSPLFDAEGRRSGALLIVEADDWATVQRFAQASPYTKAGLYERVDIDRIDPEVGALH